MVQMNKLRQRHDTGAFEDGGRGHEPRDIGSLSKVEDARNRFSLEPPEGTQPCQHLDFGPV